MPKTKNVTAVSKAKCLEKLEKLKAELGAVTKKTTPTMSFGEWMDFWYQTYCKNTLKESTQATYEERIYKQIIPKIGHHPLNQITTGLLEKFYAQLKSNGRLVKRDIYGPGLANSVIRSIHAHCRAALEKAVAEKLIRQNPAIGCKLPSKKSAEVKILTPEAMQKLLFQAQIEVSQTALSAIAFPLAPFGSQIAFSLKGQELTGMIFRLSSPSIRLIILL